MNEEAQQAAVNPVPPNSVNLKTHVGDGAPPAITEEAKKEMRREAVATMKDLIHSKFIKIAVNGAASGVDITTDESVIARFVCEAIYTNKIPHVRFCYENN